MVAPVMSSAVNQPFPCTVEVTFSQNMLANTALTSPSTYTFNHGAYTASVSILEANKVRLVVENLFDYPSYTITALPGLESAASEDLNTAVTVSVSVSLGTYSAEIDAISAANGRLMSGKIAKRVFSDYSNWYIVTETGLDVVDKHTLFNKGYILQESGFTSIFVTEPE